MGLGELLGKGSISVTGGGSFVPEPLLKNDDDSARFFASQRNAAVEESKAKFPSNYFSLKASMTRGKS